MLEKKYYERYLLESKQVVLTGLAFKRAEHGIVIDFETLKL
jgi:hypothetical protein